MTEVFEAIEEVKAVRGTIDDLFSAGPRKKLESDLFLQANEQLNTIQGLLYSIAAKQAKED